MFQEFLKSKESIKTYTWTLGNFIKYHNLKDYDSIVQIKKPELQKLIETYVIHLKKTIGPNSVSTYGNHIKTFLEANDIDLNWRRIKRLYPAKVKRSGSSAYLTQDIKKMLDVTKSLRNKAVIHFLASTGVRIGALPELKIKHLRDMPLGCKMVTIYEDSTEEYQTFLTPEASQALEETFEQRRKRNEILTEESPLFRSRYLLGAAEAKPITKPSLQAILRRAINNTTIRGQKKNGRYKEQLAHGFRKRFNTILKLNKQVNDNVIEKMMGHKRGLDGTYLVLTPEQLFEEFKNGIMDLTIDSTERQKIKIEALENENSELERVYTDLQQLKKENMEFRNSDTMKDLVKEEMSKIMSGTDSKLIRELDDANDSLLDENKELKKKLKAHLDHIHNLES